MEIDDFCCPICENVYDEEKHIPRLLMKCGHSYCEICIKNQITENNKQFICKEDNELYEKIESISDIPKNLSLLNLLKKAKLRTNNNNLFHSANNLIKNTNFNSNSANDAVNNGTIGNFNNNLKFRTFTPVDYSNVNFSFMSSANKANANIQQFNNTSPGFFSSENMSNNNNYNSNNINSNSNTNNNYKEINSLTRRDSQQRKISSNPIVNEFNLEAAASSYNNYCENDFNFSINKGNNNNNNNLNTNNYCFIHNRKTEIVCLDDKVKICTSCALFGDHKNHNLKSEEDLSKEFFIKSEILIEYFEMMENFDAKIKEFKNPEYLMTLEKIEAEANEKQKNLKESVALFFKEIRLRIQEREEFILNQITNDFSEHVDKKVLYFKDNLDVIGERVINWKNEVQNLLEKLNSLSDNAENILQILDHKDEHVISAEKILHDYDLLQEGEANFVSKNLETFKLNKNLDSLNKQLNVICNFNSIFIENANNNINNNNINKNKETANDFENKFSSDLLNIHNQLENINLGYFELPELNGKIFSKAFSDENKTKNNILNNAAKNKNDNNNSKNNSEFNQRSNNKNDKESVVSQQSMINSNSTLNNNFAMLQTDSSFLSAYDENILNNNFKGRTLNTNSEGKVNKKKSTSNITNIDESFKMGQKSKHNLNSFINESFYKTTKPSVASTTTLTTKSSNLHAAAKANQQLDKQTLIKKQLTNNEIANFNGLANIGEDGLKIISDYVNVNLNNNINYNNNQNNHIHLSPNTLSSSMTLGNINTPIANETSLTSSNLGKKNVKFSEEIGNNNNFNNNKMNTNNNHFNANYNNNTNLSKKSAANAPTLSISNKNFNLQNENEGYKLKEIRLTKCNIGDEGFAILSNCFDKTGSVQVLNLKGNKLKDKSLKNVMHVIKSNKTLKHLVLLQNLFSQAKKENIKINAKLLNPNLKLEI